MTRIQINKALAFVTLLFLLATGTVLASNEDVQPSSAPDESEARALLNSGQFEEALTVLRPMTKAHPGHTNIHFLMALAAIESSRVVQASKEEREALLDEAIAALHAILINHPGLVRVRLELARAFFYKEEDTLARQHFSFLVGGY
ncbi:MAG: tetratricopeptide repeat protein, partial [Proteobacteria bacterium]|nr:tetratricopeptide repeat protein [Pseudomonadota bacterium]